VVNICGEDDIVQFLKDDYGRVNSGRGAFAGSVGIPRFRGLGSDSAGVFQTRIVIHCWAPHLDCAQPAFNDYCVYGDLCPQLMQSSAAWG